MNDQQAFAAQDKMDYSVWCDFCGDGIDLIGTPCLEQMYLDIAEELNKRRKENEIK